MSTQLLFPAITFTLHSLVYYPVSEVTYHIVWGQTTVINVLRQVIEQLHHRDSIGVLFHLHEALTALCVYLA